MNRSEQIGSIATALAKAQKALKPAVKDVTNTFFKSSYADLEAVTAACRDALSDNDIAYSQMTDFDAERAWVETILMHKSGEWLSGRYPVRPVKDDPQGLGSAVTYAKRYGLMGAVGIVATNEDDDGNAASGHHSTPAKANGKVKEPAPSAPPVSEAVKTAAAKSWARKTIDQTIPGFSDPRKFDEWQKTNRPYIAQLREIDPVLHTGLLAAIEEREALFEPANVG